MKPLAIVCSLIYPRHNTVLEEANTIVLSSVINLTPVQLVIKQDVLLDESVNSSETPGSKASGLEKRLAQRKFLTTRLANPREPQREGLQAWCV
jgi:hypothetical protein